MLIKEKIKESRIYGVTNQKIVKEILGLPDNVNIKKLDKIIDSFYDSFYIKKSSNTKSKTVKEKHEEFLNIEKVFSERFNEVPLGDKKDDYRKIVTINEIWLKNAHRKFNKILMNVLLDKKVRGIKQKSEIPYLHSSVKQRSYSTNAQVHIGDKYVFAIDLKDFYPSVTKKRIYAFFMKEFDLPSDIAMFYAVLSTCKNDSGEYKLGQGLSQSATLAYLVNYTLFNYLYDESEKLGIVMSIYVDDVVFSSDKPIPQKFIDRLFGIIKSNDMLIKKKKVHNYKKDSVKKVTGVFINGNKTRVADRKHEEMDYQYKYLKKNITNVKSFDEYFEIYNLYLKFYGNYQHIKMVEMKVHDRYTNFINKHDDYFPKGVNKKQKTKNYQKGNIKNVGDIQKINSCYQKLLNHLNN